jgi:hypothetical protein
MVVETVTVPMPVVGTTEQRFVVRNDHHFAMIDWPVARGNDPWEQLFINKKKQGFVEDYSKSKPHFSVCWLRDLVDHFKIKETKETKESFDKLRMIHCTDLKYVPREIFDQIPGLVNHILSGGEKSPAGEKEVFNTYEPLLLEKDS